MNEFIILDGCMLFIKRPTMMCLADHPKQFLFSIKSPSIDPFPSPLITLVYRFFRKLTRCFKHHLLYLLPCLQRVSLVIKCPGDERHQTPFMPGVRLLFKWAATCSLPRLDFICLPAFDLRFLAVNMQCAGRVCTCTSCPLWSRTHTDLCVCVCVSLSVSSHSVCVCVCVSVSL